MHQNTILFKSFRFLEQKKNNEKPDNEINRYTYSLTININDSFTINLIQFNKIQIKN